MTVVTFKSKSEVFEFLHHCKLNGIQSKIVSTPKEIKIGCGLAVEITNGAYYKVYAIIKNNNFYSFNGIFLIKKGLNGKSVKRLI